MSEPIPPAPADAQPVSTLRPAPLPLDFRTPPDGTPAQPCPNCLAPLYGPHCYACGQPQKGLIRQFSSILGDFFDTVLNLDSRIFRTIGPLYTKPGYLTLEYFAGRRVRYVTPFRLFFFLAVIAFLVISAVTNPTVGVGEDGIRLGPQIDTDQLAAMPQAEREAKLKDLDVALSLLPEAERAKVKADLAREIEIATEARKQAAEAKAKARRAREVDGRPGAVETESDDERELSFNDKPWDAQTNPLEFSWLTQGMNRALNETIGEVKGKLKDLRKNPAPLVKEIFSLAPQTLFVMLPLFALLLKAVYLYKRRLYMEHLMVALHSHAFICLSMLALVTLYQVQSRWYAEPGIVHSVLGFLQVLAWSWLPLYLLVMQKRVYRQGWIMTVLKFGIVGICYSVLLGFGMVGTVILSLVVL